MSTKLNIGCGINVVQGNDWINCDNSSLAKLRKTPLWIAIKWLINMGILPDIYRNYPNVKIVDIRSALPFADNSIDFIYCSQVVEHLFLYDLTKFLRECKRVLKPNGVIRRLTPDLNKTIKLYLNSELDKFEANDGLKTQYAADHLNLIFYPRSWVFREKRSWLTRIMDAIPEHHKYIFDYATLSSLLLDCGFKSANEVPTETTAFPDADKLDKYQSISLEIEAIK